MHLFAALSPPAHVRGEVLRAITGVQAPHEDLDDVDAAVPLVRLGHVTPADLRTLTAALSALEVRALPAVWVVGPARAVDTTAHELGLEGDLDGLHELFGAAHVAARRAGFLLDRRGFEPALRVRVPPDLRIPDELTHDEPAAGFRSVDWTVEAVHLVRDVYDDGDVRSEPVARTELRVTG